MSSSCSSARESSASQLNDVMVRQVNLAAAFHDHISCTKISHSVNSNVSICALESQSDEQHEQHQHLHQSLPSYHTNHNIQSLPCETDHMYATDQTNRPHNSHHTHQTYATNDSKISIDNKSILNHNLNDTNSNSNSNGIILNAFNDSICDERSQIQKLTEMILAQLDLIQHQQEQLLKKDRQLQGLKQDREALCLRLEKMEKRIAVLTNKVANINNSAINSNSNTNSTTNATTNATNNNSNSLTEMDCDQSGSDTIIEDNNNVIGLLTDPTVFAKLYSQSNASNSCNFNTISNTSHTNSSESLSTVRIKAEQTHTESNQNSITIRKNRKRNPENVYINSSINDNCLASIKKRCNSNCVTSTNISANDFECKKEVLTVKETSSDSLSTTQSGKLGAKKKVQKLKCESVLSDNVYSFNHKTYVTKEILTTSTPYSLIVNANSQLDLSVSNNNDNTNHKIVNINTIEVPFWRIHAVSSCYSLEGTENLDDEVFNRRHYKLEIDERRRKRWDIQRLREQRHNEKLRTGRYYSGSLGNCLIEKPSDLKRKNCEFSSFFPDPKNVQSIEVTENLPLVAFGHSIPQLPPKPFSLPWITGCEKPQTSTSKARHSASTIKKH